MVFLLQRDENAMEGWYRCSPLPALPAFLGSGRRQWENHFRVCPGSEDHSGQTRRQALRGSPSVLGSVFMKPESNLLVYSKYYKQ